ncbi:hypothetical protein [Kordia sp.]|uniref:hypothetical protein n=1 Tax=Kordia sp. TaxID=1965332 RepID=UPI003B5CF556
MTFHEKLENYFNSILNFNWENFNKLNVRKQASDWKMLFSEFDEIVRKEYELNGIDFAAVIAMIRLHSNLFRELPIESSLYTIINKELIAARLYDFTLNLEYEDAKKRSTAICDCELLHKFKIAPETTHLKEMKTLHDGYYNPTLLECTICNFQWISYASDDSTGKIVFEKYEAEA